jgi:aspartyl-tRNA synthetase
VFDPQVLSAEQFDAAGALRDEYVLAVCGSVRRRPEGTENPNLATGEVEVLVAEFEVLNTCKTLPFKLDEYTTVNEDVRLRYRFLDLRRPEMQRNFSLRHKLFQVVRKYFSDNGFMEFTTPILTKSTPEGARDFLVPSRLNPGCFYALPQSPQLFKQLLMVAGYDRYFQLAPCFRDEDLRANRQPEFWQIDVEMSFISPEDIYAVMEGMISRVWRECIGVEVPVPFPRLPYERAMLEYGSDKPDLRFDLRITELTDFFQGTEIKVFAGALAAHGRIRGLRVPGGAAFSRKQLDDYTAFVSHYGAKGLAWFKVLENELQSPLTKFFTPELVEAFKARMGAQVGDIIFVVAASEKVVCDALGQLRLKIASDLDLIPRNKFSFAWITDFPLFEWSEREKVFTPSHHPFTAPVKEDIPLLDEYNADPTRWRDAHPDDHPLKRVRALAYDLAINGEEAGGGSIRIHRRDVQNKVFRAIGIDEATAERKFGFLLDALSYGAPPHGGIAFGVERMLMLLLGERSIREVIPFPKTQSGADLMVDAPSPVDEDQLRELHIRVELPLQEAEKQKP